jgi:hypothetical protein
MAAIHGIPMVAVGNHIMYNTSANVALEAVHDNQNADGRFAGRDRFSVYVAAF